MLFKNGKKFLNTLNSKTDQSNIFMYQFADKLNLKNPNNNVALANLSIYYTWKNIKSEYNNKFKISAPTWNDEFNLPDGSYSVSDVQVILNISSKNMKLLLIILQCKFMSIK